ncbi:MAG: ATP-binding protein, partial [Phycisphaerae bacterium]
SESFVDDLFADSRPSSSSTTTTESMIQRIVAGGYPEIQTRPLAERREAWFQSYVMTILQRDVRDMANIQNFTELPRLLRLIASRSGSLINYADLSRDLGMPQTTLRRYLNLLEITFLIRRVPAWFSNIGKRLVKSPKIYLGDTGLLSHLLAANKDRIKNDPALHGHLLENFVALELLKQISWSTINPQLHHFRTQAGSEVDFLLEDRAGRLVAIEVKRTATIKTKDLRGIQTIREVAGARFLRGCILYMGTNTVPFDSQVSALPISSLWTNATFE